MVDTVDSKSIARKGVRVRIPPRAPTVGAEANEYRPMQHWAVRSAPVPVQGRELVQALGLVLGAKGLRHVPAVPAEHWPSARVADRRANPGFGYRAIHVIVHTSGSLLRSRFAHSFKAFGCRYLKDLATILGATSVTAPGRIPCERLAEPAS
jgi:hypothetical protein